MKCWEIMTRNPVCCSPDDSIERAALLMKMENVGALPVVSADKEILGIVTDRDIAIRIDAEARAPKETPVSSVMSKDVFICRKEQDVERALELMLFEQVRRLPVLDDSSRVVGIISKVDLARRLSPKQVSALMSRVLSPAARQRRQPEESKRSWFRPALLAAGTAAAGATLMFLLDPVRGRSRRSVLKGKARHACHEAVKAAERLRNDVVNRSLGVVAEAQSRLHTAPVADEILVQRVRAKLGRVVAHPHDITVTADKGVVTLSGRVLEREARRLLRSAEHVLGVVDVVDHLRAVAEIPPEPQLRQPGLAVH